MALSDTPIFPGFLTTVLTQLFFPKPLTTSLGNNIKAGTGIKDLQGRINSCTGHCDINEIMLDTEHEAVKDL